MENGTANGTLENHLEPVQNAMAGGDGLAAPDASQTSQLDPATVEMLTGLGIGEDQMAAVAGLPQPVLDRILGTPAPQTPTADFERFAAAAEGAMRQPYPGYPGGSFIPPAYNPQLAQPQFQPQPTTQQVIDAAKILGVDPKALRAAYQDDPNMQSVIGSLETMGNHYGTTQQKIAEYERMLAEQVEITNNMSQTLARHMGMTQLRTIDPELYGTGRMTPAQQALATRVMDKAVAIHAGARMHGLNVPFEQALEGAHEVINRDRIAKRNQKIGADQAAARSRAAIARPDGTSHNRPANPGGHVAALQGVLNRIRPR